MKRIKQIVACAFAVIGILLTIEGFRVSRPTYYLTIPGSSPDDYTAGGYMMLTVGIVFIALAILYLLLGKQKADK